MNPRHRRLLIPGLLVTLIVVVAIASLVRRADGATLLGAAGDDSPVASTRVSTLDDPRITESSGLAVSSRHRDLAYTIDDSGSDPQVFAIRVSTGRTVGVTTVTGAPWVDTEAMALDGDGGLWIADTGDNRAIRDDVALYRIDEPGPGDHRATAAVHPLDYADGPVDVESLAIDPTSGCLLLVTKDISRPRVLEVPRPADADTSSAPVTPTSLDWAAPPLATDASWTPDGRQVVVRTYQDARVLDARTGAEQRSFVLPRQQQGETLAVEPSGQTMLIGSEGEDSALLRVALASRAPGAAGSTATAAGADAESGWAISLDTGVLKTIAVVLIVLVTALLLRLLWRRRQGGAGPPR